MILFFDWIVQKTNSDFVSKFSESPCSQLNRSYLSSFYCQSVYKNIILFLCVKGHPCVCWLQLKTGVSGWK